MGKAAAAAALRQARRRREREEQTLTRRRDARRPPGPDDGYVPTELASALTALKAMEVLRRRLGSDWCCGCPRLGAGNEPPVRRLVASRGGARRTPSTIRRAPETGVAASGPSLLCALRAPPR